MLSRNKGGEDGKSTLIEPARKVHIVIEVGLWRRSLRVIDKERNIQLMHGGMAAVALGQGAAGMVHLSKNGVLIAEHA